jgi:hypothetical protein
LRHLTWNVCTGGGHFHILHDTAKKSAMRCAGRAGFAEVEILVADHKEFALFICDVRSASVDRQ